MKNFKFKINGYEWVIKEVEQKVFWEDALILDEMNTKEHATEYCYGRTKYSINEIWIDKSLPQDIKRKTLLHELMHCYKTSFICLYSMDNQDEDFWCELSANSHDIIHEIVENYFK